MTHPTHYPSMESEAEITCPKQINLKKANRCLTARFAYQAKQSLMSVTLFRNFASKVFDFRVFKLGSTEMWHHFLTVACVPKSRRRSGFKRPLQGEAR